MRYTAPQKLQPTMLVWQDGTVNLWVNAQGIEQQSPSSPTCVYGASLVFAGRGMAVQDTVGLQLVTYRMDSGDSITNASGRVWVDGTGDTARGLWNATLAGPCGSATDSETVLMVRVPN